MDISNHPTKGVLINGYPLSYYLPDYQPPKPPEPPKPVVLGPPPATTFLLPSGTRHLEVDKPNSLTKILIEVKPSIVVFNWDLLGYKLKDIAEKGSANVAVPWQYFWLYFQHLPENMYGKKTAFFGGAIFWAQDRLVDLSSPAYPAPLPNISLKSTDHYNAFGRGTICWGNGNKYLGNLNGDISLMAEQIVAGFYEISFNPSIQWPIPFGTPEAWEKESKKDPYGWMKWKELTGATKEPMSKLLAQSKPRGY